MKFIQAHQIAKKTSAYPEDALADVPFGEFVLERRGRLGDGGDEAEVEEQLQCGCGAVFLIGKTGDQRPVPRADGGG